MDACLDLVVSCARPEADKPRMIARPVAKSEQSLRDKARGRPPRSLLCFSVDVEEYYHAEAFAHSVPRCQWGTLPRRAAAPLERLREMLGRSEQRATLFVLGLTVRPLAHVLRQFVADGHEIACHGHAHAHFSRMSPESLRDDLRIARTEIEDVLGVSPAGYRAPTFSLTHRTNWALDVIAEAGFEYDASISPIRHDRYGAPDAPLDPFWAVAPGGERVFEFPALAVRVMGWRLPLAGGGYLRLFPTWMTRAALASRDRANRAGMVYIHPWELDPNQPELPLSFASRWRHRVNLHKTQRKLASVLDQFRFDTAARIVEHLRARPAASYAL